MLVMALDVGTSSARAICFDELARAQPAHEDKVGYAPRTTPDGGVELDPDELLDAVTRAIDGAVSGLPAGAEVAAVGISAFWHGLLALDAAGRPLTPVLTWADTRGAATAAALRRRLPERAVHRRTGAPLHAAFFPAKLRWLRESRPEVFARARTWCGFAEYLAGRLTGRATSSVSMASGTGLLDQSTCRWDEDLLRVCEVDPERLAPIDDAAAEGLAPEWRGRWPALARARWFPAWGDGACSNLGSDCAAPDRIALNVGTSAALRVVTASPPDVPPGLWRYRVDGRRSVLGGATSEGGNVVAWCRKTLALPADDEEVERSISALAPAGHGLTALPFLAGERSPGWREEARGYLGGLALATSPVEILRALMESIAFRLALVYELVAPLAEPGHTVIVSGGALLHSAAWAGIVADVLGVPLALSGELEASSRGAALLALAGIGAPPPPAAALGPTVRPDPGRREVYRRALQSHRRLYETVVGPRMS